MITPRFLVAIRADWLPDFGEEESQEIGELRGGSHRGTGGADRILLLDGNCRTNVDHAIDIRAVHLVEKHSGIRRQGLHIAPLSFRKQCVERQRGFARSGETGDGGDLVVWNPQGNILQIVLACAFDDQVVRGFI